MNTTKECKRDLLERLTKLRFDITENEIFTSLMVWPLLLVDDKALPDFMGEVEVTEQLRKLVVGLDPEHFHYEMMNTAFQLMLILDDVLALGPRPFVAGLEYATNAKATVVGKPEKTFSLEALQGTECAPEAIMIGNDCRDDVGGPQNASMHGILVRTDEDNLAPYLTCEKFPVVLEHILEHLL
uniref:Haloacid dehalogenase-like hydrolase domain-containing protein 2 n=1 Tax=Calidris pygmaea TaxID=425635 RepID=A0A8C3JMN5_9CHAR